MQYYAGSCQSPKSAPETNNQRHFPTNLGHDAVPQLDPGGHLVRGRVRARPAAGLGSNPADEEPGALH